MSFRPPTTIPPSPRSPRAPDSPSARRRSSSPPSKEERLNGRSVIEDVKHADAVRGAPSTSKPPPPPAPAPIPVAAAQVPLKKEVEDVQPVKEEEPTTSPDMIDEETFNQIVELDEDDTHDFSYGMVKAYFTQARSTFDEMEQAFAARNLLKLSDLGHFLKGSSAALGITRVQKSCERMQHYGKKWDEEAGSALTEEGAMKKIEPLLGKVKGEYGDAEKWLKGWYVDRGVKDED